MYAACVRFAGALAEFIDALRHANVPVSMVEALDAVEALQQVDVLDRIQFRTALRATLVKRVQHAAAFEALFDVYFTLRRSPSTGDDAVQVDDEAGEPS